MRSSTKSKTVSVEKGATHDDQKENLSGDGVRDEQTVSQSPRNPFRHGRTGIGGPRRWFEHFDLERPTLVYVYIFF